MAKQMATAGLAAALGSSLDNAVQTHKADETVLPGGGRLPAGIENGVAQVDKVGFAQYAKGKLQGQWYYMASGIVKEPKTFNGSPLAGQRTQVGPIPLCDTPDSKSKPTKEHHVADVLNEFRKMGVDTKTLNGPGAAALEQIAAALSTAKPHIRFRTWQGQKQVPHEEGGRWYIKSGDKVDKTKHWPSQEALKQANPFVGTDPRVNEDWCGVVAYEGDADGAPLDGVNDNTPEATTYEEPADLEAGDAGAGADEAGAEDLTALGEAADGGDTEAMQRLQALAEEKGIDPNDIATWAEVAALVGENGGDAAPTAAAAEGGRAEDWRPAKDEPYYFVPKGKRKAVEGQVTQVFPGTRTVNIKDLADNIVHRGVSWDGLKDEG